MITLIICNMILEISFWTCTTTFKIWKYNKYKYMYYNECGLMQKVYNL